MIILAINVDDKYDVIFEIYEGCVTSIIADLTPHRPIDVCITSPPYFQKFDYENEGQLGLELTVDAYLQNQVSVFRGIRNIMVEGGTCFIVIGDTSNNYSPIRAKHQRKGVPNDWLFRRKLQAGFHEKETLNIPFRLATALHDDGWIHRTTLIWDKGYGSQVANSDVAPESHEYVLHLIKWSKSGRPYGNTRPLKSSVLSHRPVSHSRHGCVYPLSLVRELLAVCPPGCAIIDPYVGSGTTWQAAVENDSYFVGIDLNCSLLREMMLQPQYSDGKIVKMPTKYS